MTSNKYNASSLQVLKTLLALLKGDYTMAELIDKLNKKEKKPVFNNSVISKYINSCRYCGIDIPKINNKYFVAKMPFGLDLSLKDISLLERMQQIIASFSSSKNEKIFKNFLSKLNKFSNKDITCINNKDVKIAFEKFDKAILETRKIRFLMRNKEDFEAIPLEVVRNKNKTFFNVYDGEKEFLISTDKVIGLELSDKKFSYKFTNTTVIFKIKGGLKDRYTLKDSEQIVEVKPEYIAISNKEENKEILFSRLLRYDSCCEIVHPKNYREEMIKIIENTLSNYEVQ